VGAEEKLHCPGLAGHINNELKVNTAGCFGLFSRRPRAATRKKKIVEEETSCVMESGR
jgi:hypothetical protein